MAGRPLFVASYFLWLPVCSAAALLGGESWRDGVATWYGEPYGPGSNGGACSYGFLPSSGYGSIVAAAGDTVFQNGHGCGTCYEVKCMEKVCQDKPIRVAVTDRCPECLPDHFDLSGAAISSLGLPGRASQVRAIGIIGISYRRVACEYPNSTLTFTMDKGSTPWWLAFSVMYVEGAGDFKSVEIQQQGEVRWHKMSKNWGANYMSQSFHLGPLSVRITGRNGDVTLCKNVIPVNWKPGASYTCASS